MNLLRGNATLNNFVKEFIDINDNGNGDYDFGKLTKDNLKTSDPHIAPSEIDKRTKVIAKYLKEIYLDKMKY